MSVERNARALNSGFPAGGELGDGAGGFGAGGDGSPEGGGATSPQPFAVSRAIMAASVIAADVAFRQRCSLDGAVPMPESNSGGGAVVKAGVAALLLKNAAV